MTLSNKKKMSQTRLALHRIKNFESIVGKGTLSSSDPRWTLEPAPTASSAYVRLCC